MTLKELNDHRELRLQREDAMELLHALQGQAHPASPSFSDMPKSTDYHDKISDLAIEICEMESRVEYYDRQIEKEEVAVKDYIQSLGDDYIRLLFRLRFIRCFSWKAIAVTLGRGVTENSVKKMCYRTIREKMNERRKV